MSVDKIRIRMYEKGTVHRIYDGMGKTRSQLWISQRKIEFATIP